VVVKQRLNAIIKTRLNERQTIDIDTAFDIIADFVFA